MNTGIGDVVAKETEEIGEKEMFATKEHMDTTDAHFACWTNCYVSIDNSWINPAALSKEVGRILKIRLQEMEQSAAENEEKLKAVFGKLAESEEKYSCLKEKYEKQVEAFGLLNKEFEEQKEIWRAKGDLKSKRNLKSKRRFEEQKENSPFVLICFDRSFMF